MVNSKPDFPSLTGGTSVQLLLLLSGKGSRNGHSRSFTREKGRARENGGSHDHDLPVSFTQKFAYRSPLLFSFCRPSQTSHGSHTNLNAEKRAVDSSNPNLVRLEHLLWRPYEIFPGVWKYRYRIGHHDWLIFDHHAER
ncbi:hypothetical protein HO173_007157 [Letharia columbiana]|uniref:Uncharacterized protein n=1 Tax=Letharia columbiana TaxID=112416 RepID=A0A8H6FTK8_9LECA|nr:uncharacterized protein HO173_007157 [Letharia columbiana]KAF6234532.1 hypothetical protein HO173_007157 [Letharia columbiana]